MAPTDLWTAVDEINLEGLFASIIQALEDLPNSKSAGWDTLAAKMKGYKTQWDTWYRLVEKDQDPFLSPNTWKGKGSLSYESLNQTVCDLCKALEDCKDPPLQ